MSAKIRRACFVAASILVPTLAVALGVEVIPNFAATERAFTVPPAGDSAYRVADVEGMDSSQFLLASVGIVPAEVVMSLQARESLARLAPSFMQIHPGEHAVIVHDGFVHLTPKFAPDPIEGVHPDLVISPHGAHRARHPAFNDLIRVGQLLKEGPEKHAEAGALMSQLADGVQDVRGDAVYVPEEQDARLAVLRFAQYQAKTNMRHPAVGPAHLLLSLVSMRNGVAAQVLADHGVDAAAVRQSIDRIIGTGRRVTAPPDVDLPFTSEVPHVLRFSLAAARLAWDPAVGTKHLLLGLLEVAKRDSMLDIMLTVHYGLRLDALQTELLNWRPGRQRPDQAARHQDAAAAVPSDRPSKSEAISDGPKKPLAQVISLGGRSIPREVREAFDGFVRLQMERDLERAAERVREVVQLAREEAERLHSGPASSEHLLLGLVALGDGIPARVLAARGVDLEAARSAIQPPLDGGRGAASQGTDDLTPLAWQAVGLAAANAKFLGYRRTDVEHLLVALLEEGNLSTPFLARLGLDREELKRAVFSKMDEDRQDAVAAPQPSGLVQRLLRWARGR